LFTIKLHYKTSCSNFTLRFENRQHRPKETVFDNPKAWWRYAISSIRDDVRKRLERTSWKNNINTALMHKRYVKMWKLTDKEYAKKMKLKYINAEKILKKDKEKFQIMEDQLTINEIMEFRQQADDEVKLIKEEWKGKKHKKKKR
jgi:hypothetical protein|tara:strand:+ start:1270 stop:1704 length:435 start_codon:yes stop_codon:yes gene_type:complete